MNKLSQRAISPGGLRRQLIFGVGFVVIFSLIFFALTTMQLQKKQLQKAATDQASAIVRLVGDTSQSSTLTDDYRHSLNVIAQSFKLSLLATIHRTEITVTTDNAMLEHWYQLAYETFRSTRCNHQINCLSYDSFKADINSLTESTGEHFTSVDGTPYLFYSSVVAQGEPHIVVVAQPLSSLQRVLDNHQKLIWLFILINTLLIVILTYALLTFYIIRPLRALRTATQRASQGDYTSAINHLPTNEFGQLGRQFNAMLTEIQASRETLEHQLADIEASNRQLTLTQASLIHAEKLASVGHLSAGMAHEIGNPLASLMGYADLLEDGELSTEMQAEILGNMKKQLQRIHTIIRSLLDYSRRDDAEIISKVSITQVIQDAIDLIKVQTTFKNIAIAVDVDPSCPAISTQPAALTQVLVNLLLNSGQALQSLDRAPEISIHAITNRESSIDIIITDNGPGIAQDILPHIFDPFFTTKQPGDGTGLGLYISLNLVQAVGGELIVENASPTGTSATIRLPATHNPADTQLSNSAS